MEKLFETFLIWGRFPYRQHRMTYLEVILGIGFADRIVANKGFDVFRILLVKTVRRGENGVV